MDMQPNNRNTHNAPPQQPTQPIVGKIYRFYKYSIVSVIVVEAFFCLLSLIAIPAAPALIPLTIVLVGVLVVLLKSSGKIPKVTTLNGSTLTTRGFHKSRTVDLSQLSAVNIRWNLVASGARVLFMRRYVLELTDSQNNSCLLY